METDTKTNYQREVQKMSQKQVYRHYGANNLDRTFKYKAHALRYKPSGLWSSPIQSEYYTWKEFCENEDFHVETLNRHFDFCVKENAKILEVRDIQDILPYLCNDEEYEIEYKMFQHLYSTDPTAGRHLNLSKLYSEYDGMEVFMSPMLHHSTMFYSWDVDSLVVWNLEIIELNTKCS